MFTKKYHEERPTTMNGLVIGESITVSPKKMLTKVRRHDKMATSNHDHHQQQHHEQQQERMTRAHQQQLKVRAHSTNGDDRRLGSFARLVHELDIDHCPLKNNYYKKTGCRFSARNNFIFLQSVSWFVLLFLTCTLATNFNRNTNYYQQQENKYKLDSISNYPAALFTSNPLTSSLLNVNNRIKTSYNQEPVSQLNDRRVSISKRSTTSKDDEQLSYADRFIIKCCDDQQSGIIDRDENAEGSRRLSKRDLRQQLVKSPTCAQLLSLWQHLKSAYPSLATNFLAAVKQRERLSIGLLPQDSQYMQTSSSSPTESLLSHKNVIQLLDQADKLIGSLESVSPPTSGVAGLNQRAQQLAQFRHHQLERLLSSPTYAKLFRQIQMKEGTRSMTSSSPSSQPTASSLVVNSDDQEKKSHLLTRTTTLTDKDSTQPIEVIIETQSHANKPAVDQQQHLHQFNQNYRDQQATDSLADQLDTSGLEPGESSKDFGFGLGIQPPQVARKPPKHVSIGRIVYRPSEASKSGADLATASHNWSPHRATVEKLHTLHKYNKHPDQQQQQQQQPMLVMSPWIDNNNKQDGLLKRQQEQQHDFDKTTQPIQLEQLKDLDTTMIDDNSSSSSSTNINNNNNSNNLPDGITGFSRKHSSRRNESMNSQLDKYDADIGLKGRTLLSSIANKGRHRDTNNNKQVNDDEIIQHDGTLLIRDDGSSSLNSKLEPSSNSGQLSSRRRTKPILRQEPDNRYIQVFTDDEQPPTMIHNEYSDQKEKGPPHMVNDHDTVRVSQPPIKDYHNVATSNSLEDDNVTWLVGDDAPTGPLTNDLNSRIQVDQNSVEEIKAQLKANSLLQTLDWSQPVQIISVD